MKADATLFIAYMHFCLLAFQMSFCQFPRSCVDDESLQLRECCPKGNDGSKCGQLSGRGLCRSINPAPSNLSNYNTLLLLLDDRARWPIAFFDKACFCFGNFDGVDCSRCKPSYEGIGCATKSRLRLRKNILTMSLDEVKTFINIVDNSKRTNSEDYVILTTAYDQLLQGKDSVFVNASVYDVFVWMHSYVTRDNFVFPEEELIRLNDSSSSSILENRDRVLDGLFSTATDLEINSNVDYAHEGPGFLTWHRIYMLKWEEEIRKLVAKDEEFTLPYWDWRDSTTCDVCNDAMFGDRDPENDSLISESSPFAKWQIVCSRGNDYMLEGEQCTGTSEGPILRNPGSYDSQKTKGLPTTADVLNTFFLGIAYDTPDFTVDANSSFRNLLEGFADPETGIADYSMSYLHNAVHLYMNGTMSSVDTSANDPVFLVHHTFVDSLFEVWLRTKNQLRTSETFLDLNSASLGHRPQDYMVPFFPLVTNRAGFVETKELGYVYDYLVDIGEESDEKGMDDITSGDDLTVNRFNMSTAAVANNVVVNLTNLFELATDLEFRNANFEIITRKPKLITGSTNFTHSRNLGLNKRIQYKGKRQRSHRWNRRRIGEGGFFLNNEIAEDIIAPFGQSEMQIDLLKSEESETEATSHTGTSNNNLWERFKKWLSSINQSLNNMRPSDIIWLIFTCTLLISCACLLICMCRSWPRSYPRKRRCCQRCCYGYHVEPQEELALIDRPTTQPSNTKFVKAKLYTVG